MLRECRDILTNFGLSWILGKKSSPEQDQLGTRDTGLVDTFCFMTDGVARIKIFNSTFFENFGIGNWSLGLLVNIPVGGDDLTVRYLATKDSAFELYLIEGRIGIAVYEKTTGDKISIETTGRNWADSKTRFISAYRISNALESHIILDIFGDTTYKIQLPLDFEIGNTNDIYLLDNCWTQTKIGGVMIQTGLEMTVDLQHKYLMNQKFPLNDVVTYTMNNFKGNIVYDSSGLQNHALVENYTDAVWVVDSTFLNWSNLLGYSTGQYVIDAGTDQVDIGGILYPIDSESLVPIENERQYKDVLTTSAQYLGRARLNVRIEDILCYKGNGLTFGSGLTIDFEPGVDNFSILLIINKQISLGGTIFSLGDKINVRVNPTTGNLEIDIAGQSDLYLLSDGWNKIVINIDSLNCNVQIEGVDKGSFSIGETWTSPDFRLFANISQADILTSSAALLLFNTELLSQQTIDAFFSEGTQLPIIAASAFVPMSGTDILFDVSGKQNHVTLNSYLDTVWSGRQDVLPYFLKGFKRVYDINAGFNSSVIIPFSLRGSDIPYQLYENQANIRVLPKRGIPIFDAYINFNPEEKEVGFYSRFWNKSSSDIWESVDPQFQIAGKLWSWNLSELNQTGLELALFSDKKRFGFVGTLRDQNNISIEVYDILLLNTGNDIDEKNIKI